MRSANRVLAKWTLAVLIGLAVPAVASAAPILPGFDGFVTPASAGAFVDLTGFGLGVVPVEGVPLVFNGNEMNVDTIVARLEDGPLHDDNGIIDIELGALSLVSVAPVNLTPLGGPFVGIFSDLHVTIDRGANFWTGLNPFPDGTGAGPSPFDLPFNTFLQRSKGLMNIHHPLNFHAGGTFDACFGNATQCTNLGQPGLGQLGGGIFASAFFTVPGSVIGPLNTFLNLAAPQINLAATGNFLHIPIGGAFPSGNFVVNSIAHTGPHPTNTVSPITPEPSTAMLLGFGLLVLLAGVRRGV